MSDAERYKAKCRNCTACEENDNWCDFWETFINDVDKAYCSLFFPRQPIGDENNASNNK